jgi:Beta-glucosidase-related glycosidases
MKLHQLIAQMVVVRACGHLYDRQIQYPQWELDNRRLETLIRYYGIGGVILLGGSAPEIYLRTQQLQAWSDHPLLFAADIEEGVGQRFKGGTRFPPPMALERCDPDRAYQMGRITAQEATGIGINWLLAPVADINSNPANPVINVRAFGRSPDVVIPRIRAFIHGARNTPF